MVFAKTLLFFVIFLYFLVLALIVYGIKYRNPYSLTAVIGKKGSGKTTLITKLTQRYLSKGWKVYSTTPTPGAYLFDPQDFGKISFDANSVIFVDEIGIIFDNRNFASFGKDKTKFFKLQRHYRVKVFVFSQAMDFDIKIRNLCDSIYLVRTWFNVLSVARKVNRSITIVHPVGDGESRLADDLDWCPLILAPFGGLMLTWIPHWIRYFDSFEAPELAQGTFSLCGYPDDFSERTFSFRFSNFFWSTLDRFQTRLLGHYWKLGTKLGLLSASIGDVGTYEPSRSDSQSEEDFVDVDPVYLDDDFSDKITRFLDKIR